MATSFGSGFIVTTDGYVVTNAHVVQHAAGGNVQVTLSNSKIKNAHVHAIDAQSDIAVVKIDDTLGSSEEYPAVTIGQSSKLRPGDFVIAIGAPVMVSCNIVKYYNR
jgi:serine protease Do